MAEATEVSKDSKVKIVGYNHIHHILPTEAASKVQCLPKELNCDLENDCGIYFFFFFF